MQEIPPWDFLDWFRALHFNKERRVGGKDRREGWREQEEENKTD